MVRRSKTLRRRDRTRRLLKGGIAGSIVAPISAAIAVTALDNIRKKRVPGGVKGFPALPPADTEVAGAELRVYTEGQSLYSDMLEAINNATDFIFFETYVWRADIWGRKFKAALVRAAERGVNVYIIFDGFGNLNQSPAFKRFPKLPTLHVHMLSAIRIGLLTLNARKTGRTHRKVLVADDSVGFVGGFNIGDDFGNEWRDTHVRVAGEQSKVLSAGFTTFWNALRRREEPQLPDKYYPPWQSDVQGIFNLPARLLFPIRGMYLDAFDRASKSISLTTAYFIPDSDFSEALIAAAQRGVRVRILIPEYSNHIVSDWVSRPFLGSLLRGGVEIWLYQHAMNHSKTMTVDGVWSTVGTANIDRLSMMGNAEVNLEIFSPEFANKMERVFENDLTTSRQLTLEEWENRSTLTKFTEVLLGPFNAVV